MKTHHPPPTKEKAAPGRQAGAAQKTDTRVRHDKSTRAAQRRNQQHAGLQMLERLFGKSGGSQ